MSFFDEEVERIQQQVERQRARSDIHHTIVSTVEKLIEPAQRRIEKIQQKMSNLSMELQAAEKALIDLELAKTCDHEFEEAGGPSGPWQERCKNCGWIHYC